MNRPMSSLNQIAQDDEIFEFDENLGYLYSLKEDIKQLSYEKSQLNKTIETLEMESNETELNLLSQIDQLKNDNKRLSDRDTELSLLKEHVKRLNSKYQDKVEDYKSLELLNQQNKNKITVLEEELKSKEEIIKLLRQMNQEFSPLAVNRPAGTSDLVNIDLGKSTIIGCDTDISPEWNSRTIIKRSFPKQQLNISVLGDSHSRGIAPRLSSLFDNKAKVSGMVKPSAKYSQIINSLDSAQGNTILILICGSNDVYQELESEEPIDLSNGLEETLKLHINSYRYIILGNIPFRYDLPGNHIINKRILDTNLRLKNLEKLDPKIHILDLYGIPRHQHTKHGLHLSNKGKNCVSRLLFNQIKHLNLGRAIHGVQSNTKPQPSPPIQRQEEESKLVQDYKSTTNISTADTETPTQPISCMTPKPTSNSFTSIAVVEPTSSISFSSTVISKDDNKSPFKGFSTPDRRHLNQIEKLVSDLSEAQNHLVRLEQNDPKKFRTKYFLRNKTYGPRPITENSGFLDKEKIQHQLNLTT